MRKVKAFFRIIVAGMISVCILSICSLVYNYTGVHITNTTDKATDYLWEPNQIRISLAEGYSYLVMDERGYNNSYPVEGDEIDILIVGSSHMEASQVQAEEGTSYLLNSLLNDRNIYNIGISGHRFPVCVQNLQAAMDEYQPTQYMIVETEDAKIPEADMRAVLDGTFAELPSRDSGLIYYVQKYLPAVSSVYGQINSWMSASKESMKSNNSFISFAAENETADEISESYEVLFREFIAYAAQSTKGTQTQLIIMHHPQVFLDKDGSVRANEEQAYIDLFAKVCEEEGIIFVDMTEAFKQMYEEHYWFPHGFSNTVLGVGHLNEHGHEAIAQELYEAIIENEKGVQ